MLVVWLSPLVNVTVIEAGATSSPFLSTCLANLGRQYSAILTHISKNLAGSSSSTCCNAASAFPLCLLTTNEMMVLVSVVILLAVPFCRPPTFLCPLCAAILNKTNVVYVNGCGGWTRTIDLWRMKPASCLCSTPQYKPRLPSQTNEAITSVALIKQPQSVFTWFFKNKSSFFEKSKK